MPTQDLFTPKQVALAIGVSESSLKRWCDRGLLPTVRTAGGHRRIPLNGVLQFLRQSGQSVLQPEILGLPGLVEPSRRTISASVAELTEGLAAGCEETCRRLLLQLQFQGRGLAEICDEVVKPSLMQLGDRWECGEVEVYQERSACEIVQRVLWELRLAWSSMDVRLPSAIGGTLPGDEYRLPTSMCELVLLEAGWRAVSLGTNLPYATWHAALTSKRPQLFWLSVSHIADRETFLTNYPPLFEHAEELGIALILGGQALDQELRRQLRFTAFCEDMRQLRKFAASAV